MIDWTDRHCRHFHRQITRHTRLYTEMINAGAVIHGGTARHLDYGQDEHPVALQLGGSDPAMLAQAAELGQRWGYDEINLNCGCPSERVQRGAFGACLMAEAPLVAECVRAMVAAVDVPVTVKHRIGIDKIERYEFVRDFVATVAEAGCEVFIVHARNAWLQGLSPKENREIPPLRYELVYRLKQEFPQLTIVINGGIKTAAEIDLHLSQVDGVMIGREAYHNPWLMADWDSRYWGAADQAATRDIVEAEMVHYMTTQADHHQVPWAHVARHMLGLRHGLRGARRWRQVWSDHHLKGAQPMDIAALAQAASLAS